MQYVRFGSTGMRVSRLCLGMMTYGDKRWREWVLEEADARPIIRRAVELGLNFFDTADMYSVGVSEEITGRALRDFARRDEVVIATKVYNAMSDDVNDRGLSRKHIMKSIDRSLKRLGVDYVDLYQIHRFDYETPIEETLEALHDVVRAGKALYIGASSMYAWQFAKMLYTADARGWTRFVSMQNHYNLVYREEEREMFPLCRAEGVATIPWSPLARGVLAGNRRLAAEAQKATRVRTDFMAERWYSQTQMQEAVVDQVVAVAGKYGVKPAQVAIAWMLHKPGVTAPIIGVSKISQLEEMVAALDIRLDDADIAALEAPYSPQPITGHQ